MPCDRHVEPVATAPAVFRVRGLLTAEEVKQLLEVRDRALQRGQHLVSHIHCVWFGFAQSTVLVCPTVTQLWAIGGGGSGVDIEDAMRRATAAPLII